MSLAKFASLYLPSGYIDFEGWAACGLPFNFMAAARGTGKTYGACSWVVNEAREGRGKFIFLRRTNAQAEIISNDNFSPFRDLQEGLINSTVVRKYVTGVFESEDGKAVGEPLGYIAGLSTFENVRGFNALDVTTMILDEFIPEESSKPFSKDEYAALMSAYETINRNRELQGAEPLRLFCLANSNRLDNDYFLGLQIVGTCWDMIKSGKDFRIIPERGLSICLPTNSPISRKKADTALYRLTADNDYSKMAIENSFNYDETGISSRRLNEYKPVTGVGELTIYQHKSRNEYYITRRKSGRVAYFGTGAEELGKFKRACMWLWRAYLFNLVYFEDAACKALFNRYFR